MSSDNVIFKTKDVLLPISVPVGDYCMKPSGEIFACQYFACSSMFGYCRIYVGDIVETSEGFLKPYECKILKEKE